MIARRAAVENEKARRTRRAYNNNLRCPQHAAKVSFNGQPFLIRLDVQKPPEGPLLYFNGGALGQPLSDAIQDCARITGHSEVMHLMSVQRALPNNCCELGFGPPISGRDASLKAGGAGTPVAFTPTCPDLVGARSEHVGFLILLFSSSSCCRPLIPPHCRPVLNSPRSLHNI